MDKNKRLVIIPTYNEIENIERIIRYVFSLRIPFDILVVEDNSPDGTAEVVKRLMKEYEDLHILERKGKMGLGTAYIAGFKWALARDYDYIMEMDADFSHNPDDLIRLYEACVDGADTAVGSRYVSGVNVVNWPMGRVLMSYCASIYVRLVTRMKIHDATAGFVCYKREVLSVLDLDEIRLKGYGFQIEIIQTYLRILESSVRSFVRPSHLPSRTVGNTGKRYEIGFRIPASGAAAQNRTAIPLIKPTPRHIFYGNILRSPVSTRRIVEECET